MMVLAMDWTTSCRPFTSDSTLLGSKRGVPYSCMPTLSQRNSTASTFPAVQGLGKVQVNTLRSGFKVCRLPDWEWGWVLLAGYSTAKPTTNVNIQDFISQFSHACTRTHARTHTHTYTRNDACTHLHVMHARTYTGMHTYIHIYIQTVVCTHKHHNHIYMRAHTHTHTTITYTRARTHTPQSHTHTHTLTLTTDLHECVEVWMVVVCTSIRF